MKLVPEVGEHGIHAALQGLVLCDGRIVGRADDHDGFVKFGRQECEAPCDRTAPIVAAEDDRAWELQLVDEEGTHVGGDTRVGVVSEGVRWGVGTAVAHAVGGDDIEAEGLQVGDLVAPTKGQVGEAVNQEDGASVGGRGGAGAVDVAIGTAVEVGGAEGDARVVEGAEFVGGHVGEWGFVGAGIVD